jgi:hypothetical protein
VYVPQFAEFPPVTVDITEPLIVQLPAPPLVYVSEVDGGLVPQTVAVILPGGLTNAAGGAAFTVIVLVLVLVLPQASVNVHVSV